VSGHDPYNFGDKQPYEGKIQVIDPVAMEVRKTITVAADPYGLAASDDGIVYLSSGSGQWTHIYVVDMKTASIVSKMGARHRSHIKLSPDQRRLYVANTDVSPAGIEAWVLPVGGPPAQKNGGITGHQPVQIGGNIFVSPDGRFLLCQRGGVYALD